MQNNQMPTNEQLEAAYQNMRDNPVSRADMRRAVVEATVNDINDLLPSNPWTTTAPENLPWGECVEVRWGNHDARKGRVLKSFLGTRWFFNTGHARSHDLIGTEWRRIPCKKSTD